MHIKVESHFVSVWSEGLGEAKLCYLQAEFCQWFYHVPRLVPAKKQIGLVADHRAHVWFAAEFAKVSEAEWQKRLTKEEFYVARKKGTERAFTG